MESKQFQNLNNITWNQATETINVTANGSAGTITGIVNPLGVDVAAPKDGGNMQLLTKWILDFCKWISRKWSR